MKKVAILQSNYIPWKGYFDMINSVDEFIFYDDMQYTTGDWRNRNKIKTPNGLKWITIPVFSKGSLQTNLKIKDTLISDINWAKKHWNIILQNYKKAPFFSLYKDIFEELYLKSDEKYLSEINHKFIYTINDILGIKTKVSSSTSFNLIDGKTERLVDLIKQVGGSEYISGPAAKDYIDAKLFEEENIKLTWMDYSGYKEYPQLYMPFEHGVSILDLLFNCGDDANKYLKSFMNDSE